jgi:hypothetical protein
MSFLQQLKQQAQTVQNQRGADVHHLEHNLRATEAACSTIWHYLTDLVAQLNVIQPGARPLSLDGKTPWPAMRLVDFRFDARKKDLRGREVTHHMGMVWRVVPQVVNGARGRVAVNFPPDLERVEGRLRVGHVAHERLEQRHPDSNKLQAYVFEHDFAARAGITFTPEHDEGLVHWRLSGVVGLDVQTLAVRAADVGTPRLDDLAKAIVGQPSSWG